jgi:hypothetical protein
MKTDELIQHLATDLKPVQVRASPLLFSVWLGMICLCVTVLGVFVVSPRADLLNSISHNPMLLSDLFFSFGLLISALMFSGWLSTPGRVGGRIYFGLCLLFVFFLLFSLSHRVWQLDAEQRRIGFDLSGENCLFATLAFSLVVSMIAGIAIRKRAPVRPTLTGIIVGLAGLGAGGLAITLHCGSDNGLHIALWHFLLPGILTSFIGYTMGKKILQW